MTCQELVERVTDYLDGALPAAELDRLRRHLLTCDGCQAHIEQMRATVRALNLNAADRPRLSPETERAVLDAFRRWAGEPHQR